MLGLTVSRLEIFSSWNNAKPRFTSGVVAGFLRKDPGAMACAIISQQGIDQFTSM
jgi:hypothetical protein